MKDITDLKPCPFCPNGGNAGIKIHGFGNFSAQCNTCGAALPQIRGIQAAAAEWNKLANPDKILMEAFGMFLNGMAYYETVPENEEDAKQLSKSATYNFLRARNHIGEMVSSLCSMACKEVYTEEERAARERKESCK